MTHSEHIENLQHSLDELAERDTSGFEDQMDQIGRLIDEIVRMIDEA